MAELESKSKYPHFQDPTQKNIQPKKKKNAPDRPQPAWLFPPDEENPILNPKPKSNEKLQKEVEERNKSLDYMKRRVHAAPDRPAPPHLLLTLVGAFLTEYGFNSTSRLFTNERKARQVLNGWEDNLGQQLDTALPSLENIFKDFYHQWQAGKADETSSSGSDDEDSSDSDSDVLVNESDAVVSKQRRSTNAKKLGRKSLESGSETSMSEKGAKIPSTEATRTKNKTRSKSTSASPSSTSSSPSSSSESDADDELEEATKHAPISTKTGNSKKQTPPSSEKAKTETTNLKKRKATDTSPVSSESSSSSREQRPASKKAKTNAAKTATPSAGEQPIHHKTEVSRDTSPSESDSSESSTSSDSESKNHAEKSKESSASSSSATISGDGTQVSASKSSPSSAEASDTSPDSNSNDPASAKQALSVTPKAVKKHQGAKPTPLAEASKSASGSSHPSNAYQSYNYADRAYQDLSITRGKGFTKEKNKKKRGSYRGGTIDISAGKGFKFAD
ncbi:MAG: hypothetical protein Q9227_001002 [Pyrenula ochraceoflavens]